MLADSSKIGITYLCKLADLSLVDAVIRNISARQGREVGLEKKNVTWIVAE